MKKFKQIASTVLVIVGAIAGFVAAQYFNLR